MSQSIEIVQSEIIDKTQKGYPILLAGAIVLFLFTFAPYIYPMRVVYLIWIFGIGLIFPLGIIIGRILGIDLISTKNPLGDLGGIVAGPQAFYIPIFIIVYQNIPQYLPFTIGLLGGAHFLPYMWIYKSKAYLFIT